MNDINREINKYGLFLNPYSNIEFKDYPTELKELTILEVKNVYGNLSSKQIQDIKIKGEFRGKNKKKITIKFSRNSFQNYQEVYRLVLLKDYER